VRNVPSLAGSRLAGETSVATIFGRQTKAFKLGFVYYIDLQIGRFPGIFFTGISGQSTLYFTVFISVLFFFPPN